MEKEKTLCWQCQKACGRCSWSNGTFTPVQGWEAKPTTIKNRVKGDISSFLVKSCPEFVLDKWEMTYTQLAKIMGISKRTLYRCYSISQIEALKKKYQGE